MAKGQASLASWLKPSTTASSSSTASSSKRPPPSSEEGHAKRPRLEDLDDPFILDLDARRRFPIPAPPFDLSTAVSPSEGNKGQEVRKGTLDLLVVKGFLVGPGRKSLFGYLLDSLPWYKVVYEIRGMTIRTPRYTTVFGIDATNPTFDRLERYKRRPRRVPPVLERLREEVEKRAGVGEGFFNFVLVNYYADGKDSISYHSDGEDFLGPEPTIASLTLGAPRDFLMRPKPADSSCASRSRGANGAPSRGEGGEAGKRGGEVEKWTLHSGDMVVMRGKTQSTWEHSIPKRANAGGRINITFRRAINAKGTDNYYRYNVGDGPVLRFVDGKMVEADPQP